MISALAVATPHRIVRTEAAEEIYGDWRVMCEKGACNAQSDRHRRGRARYPAGDAR